MDEKIRVLIADNSPEARKNTKSFLALEPRINVVGETGDSEALVKAAVELQPDVIILDLELPKVDGIGVTEILHSTVPNSLIIVTSNEKGKHNVKKAMASGARKFIKKPFTAKFINHEIIYLYEKHMNQLRIIEKMDFNGPAKPKVITIFGTKGGVGKTVTAVNLAACIAKKTCDKVVLLDFDFQFGDVPILLNINPKRTIIDLIGDIQNIDGELIEDYLIEHASGIKILAAPLSPEYAEYITPSNIEKILNVLKEKYKYIIIDMPPTFHETNLIPLDAATRVLFVTTHDLHAIKNAKVGFQILKNLKYDEDKVDLILNRFRSRFGVNCTEIAKVIGKNILYTIPEDSVTVINSINEGKPFMLNSKNNSLCRAFEDITDSIIDIKNEVKQPLIKRILTW